MRRRRKFKRKMKSKVFHKIKKQVYFLLAMFLGVTGAHYFYEGDYQLGILCMVVFLYNLLLVFLGIKIGLYLMFSLWVLTVIHTCYNLTKSFYINDTTN